MLRKIGGDDEILQHRRAEIHIGSGFGVVDLRRDIVEGAAADRQVAKHDPAATDRAAEPAALRLSDDPVGRVQAVASGEAAADQDAVLTGLEEGKIDLKLSHGLSSRAFFELILQNTMEGFFADPLYGGNKGMAGWKLIGFPGARYDYRDHIGKPNVPYPRGPVSIYGEA